MEGIARGNREAGRRCRWRTEIREGDDWGAGFAPYRDPPKPLALANVDSDITRTLDAAERDFARIFLRRYITWCVADDMPRRTALERCGVSWVEPIASEINPFAVPRGIRRYSQP